LGKILKYKLNGNSMKLVVLIIFLLATNKLKAQYDISDDGKYVYFINNGATILQSTDDNFQLTLPLTKNQAFINGGKEFIYISQDSLCIFDLKTKSTKVSKGIGSFEEIIYPWIACRQQADDTNLVLLNITNNKKIVLNNVTDYRRSIKGNALLLTQTKSDTVNLLWQAIGNSTPAVIWSGHSRRLLDVALSEDGLKVAIISIKNSRDSATVIDYWSATTGKITTLVADGDPLLDKQLEIYKGGKRLIGFNRTGDRLLFYQQEKFAAITRIDQDETQVWSYLDAKVYPYQEHDASSKKYYATVIDITTNNIFRLERENELLEAYDFGIVGDSFDAFAKMTNYMIARRYNGDILTTSGDGLPVLSSYSFNEFNWNKATMFTAFLVSLKDGTRSVLVSNQKIYDRSGGPYFELSPSERYALYYDHDLGNYVLTELASGNKKIITLGISTKWITHGFGYLLGSSVGIFLTWLPKDQGLLISDAYSDYWKIDFSNSNNTKCITNRYGRDSGMNIRGIGEIHKQSEKTYEIIGGDDFIYHGYWYKRKNSEKLEILLPPGGEYEYSEVKKAKVANLFIVSRSNMIEPKEVLLTKDFKQFYLLVPKDTSLYRLAVKKEIIEWKTFKGQLAHGFLYKPVGFNPSKKYPVIFYYYMNARGSKSFELLEEVHGIYKNFLSRGYLVFCPEIRRSLGEIGTAGYDFVVSGAKKIMQLPYVNAKKMGLIGASFGGYQTDFLITHTDIFAAAVSESGPNDLISDFGSVNGAHRLPAAANESGQFSSGVTPWDRPDLYIKNSPLFYADRVNTPLLLRHSMDPNVPIQQSIEFYMALRRLGKKVWFLTDHVKSHTGPALMRKTNVNMADQFFDHYLKDAPAPMWMLEGIPAKLRGIESRTELDKTGRTPGPGLVIEDRRPFSEEHIKILKNRTTITLDGKIEDVKMDTSKINSNKKN
jgi:dipeptidyl aminopeptidase/acylaminoacyl peptidase